MQARRENVLFEVWAERTFCSLVLRSIVVCNTSDEGLRTKAVFGKGMVYLAARFQWEAILGINCLQ